MGEDENFSKESKSKYIMEKTGKQILTYIKIKKGLKIKNYKIEKNWELNKFLIILSSPVSIFLSFLKFSSLEFSSRHLSDGNLTLAPDHHLTF